MTGIRSDHHRPSSRYHDYTVDSRVNATVATASPQADERHANPAVKLQEHADSIRRHFPEGEPEAEREALRQAALSLDAAAESIRALEASVQAAERREASVNRMADEWAKKAARFEAELASMRWYSLGCQGKLDLLPLVQRLQKAEARVRELEKERSSAPPPEGGKNAKRGA